MLIATAATLSLGKVNCYTIFFHLAFAILCNNGADNSAYHNPTLASISSFL